MFKDWFKGTRTIVLEEIKKAKEELSKKINSTHSKAVQEINEIISKLRKDATEEVDKVVDNANTCIKNIEDKHEEIKKDIEDAKVAMESQAIPFPMFINIPKSKANKLKGDKIIPIFAITSISRNKYNSGNRHHIGEDDNFIIYYGKGSNVRISVNSEAGQLLNGIIDSLKLNGSDMAKLLLEKFAAEIEIEETVEESTEK